MNQRPGSCGTQGMSSEAIASSSASRSSSLGTNVVMSRLRRTAAHYDRSPGGDGGHDGAIQDLGEGVWQFQAPLWQTNSLLALADGEALLCDPALAPDEIEGIRAEVEQRAEGPLHLLITHGDFDHVCGIPYFAGAEVVAGEETARRIEAGSAADDLASRRRRVGLRLAHRRPARRPGRRGGHRVRLRRFPSRCASTRRATAAKGSRSSSSTREILLPGDHLSAITYPLLADRPGAGGGGLRAAARGARPLRAALGSARARAGADRGRGARDRGSRPGATSARWRRPRARRWPRR